MDRKVFTALLLSVIVVCITLLTFAIFRPFLLAMLWGAVLVVVTYPAYAQLVRILGDRRALPAFLMTVLVLLLILGPFLALTLHFYSDAAVLVEDLKSQKLETRLTRVMEQPTVRSVLDWVEEISDKELTPGAVRAWVVDRVQQPVVDAAGDILGFLFDVLAGLAVIAFSAYYFFRDGPRALRALRELMPMSDTDRDSIFGEVHSAIVAAVRGGLVTALAQGFLGLIILYILGFPQFVLWSAVMALASFIPLVGTAIVWVPLAGMLALDGEVTKALVLAGYGIVVIGMADNLLRPILVGQHMDAHPLILFFGILGGISMFGFIGIILGPVVVAFLGVTARLFRREFGRSPAAT